MKIHMNIYMKLEELILMIVIGRMRNVYAELVIKLSEIQGILHYCFGLVDIGRVRNVKLNKLIGEIVI